MTDIIRLLPDSVANQIAAGEVIQRPASVVKELIENALDAGATKIVIHIKDAGKTLIQVTDNGCGMSPVDARMAFERHATSKIKEANDLFAIRTMGFRGEAMASIAAIADVELNTKRHDDETGTFLHINASKVISQEPSGCNNGTNIQVKNLFFNIPARRKFLKSDASELKLIINEIQRVAIPNHEIAFSLYHNGSLLYDLPVSNLRKRIVTLFGKSINQALVSIESITSVVAVNGYIGLPKFARKVMGEQFFFVNGRFMRHPWFHKAIMQAYEKILPPNTFPSYFIFLEVEPKSIDINVHPTKTEIKFENENVIWQLIHAAVRESLGKFNIVPSIDFDQQGSIEIPLPPKSAAQIEAPHITFNANYNPFKESSTAQNPAPTSHLSPRENRNLSNWDMLYPHNEKPSDDFENRFDKEPEEEQTTFLDENKTRFQNRKVLQFKQKYLILPVKSGMMIIDQKRAQERIVYERLLETIQHSNVPSQQILFPHTFELDAADAMLLREILPDIVSLGFDIREFGKNSFIINGVPGMLAASSPVDVVEKLLEEFKNSPVNAKERAKEQIAITLAKASACNYGVELQPEEMDHLVDQLFVCSSPGLSPEGKTVLTILPTENIDKLFGR